MHLGKCGEQMTEFWAGKKVLVTGHTGFKGGWLALFLHHFGADVFGISLPPDKVSLHNMARLDHVVDGAHIDIRDLKSTQKFIEQCKPDIVYHLAAQPIVRTGYAEPVATYATNVLGTLNLLECIRLSDSVHHIVIVTSDKCYDNLDDGIRFTENDRLGGHDPYSSSKACAELVTASYQKSFFTTKGKKSATVRAGNVIGGGDWGSNRLLPDIFRARRANTPMIIRNPDAVRPWQHVCEPLYGYLLLGEKLLTSGSSDQFTGPWNFGPSLDSCKSVNWILERVNAQMAHSFDWRVAAEVMLKEAQTLRLDSSKALLKLGWQTRLPIEIALEWTINWYMAYENGEDMRQCTVKQVTAYIDQLKKREQEISI